MTLTDWGALSQVIYNLLGSLAAIGTVVAAIWAVTVYKNNSKLERARWASNLYEKFYEKDQLKRIRDELDCDSDREEVRELVLKEPSDFTDYLNFFEFVAFLEHSKQLGSEEITDLFGYYIGCLKSHDSVRGYVREKGYERLTNLLEKWK